MQSGRALFATVLVAVLLSCQSEPDDTALMEGTDTTAASTDSGEVWAMIGPEGGTLAIEDGPAKGTQLVIPPGALESVTRISLRPVTDATPLASDMTDAGPIVSFEPDGLILARPAILTLPTSGTESEDADEVKAVFTRSESETDWIEESGQTQIDAEKGVIVVEITHFCHKRCCRRKRKHPVKFIVEAPVVQPRENKVVPPAHDFAVELDHHPKTGFVVTKALKCKCLATVTGATKDGFGIAATADGCATQDDWLDFRDEQCPQTRSENLVPIDGTSRVKGVGLLLLQFTHSVGPATVSTFIPSNGDPDFTTAYEHHWGMVTVDSNDNEITVRTSECPVLGAPLYRAIAPLNNPVLYGIYTGFRNQDCSKVATFVATASHYTAFTQ